MEELFAIEELAKHESPALEKQARNPHQLTMPLMEIHSKEDPVLLEDSRVLNNLIDRQAEVKSKDYFATIQTEIRPHMRKIVSDWMLEVTEEQQCQPEVFHLAINYLDRFWPPPTSAKLNSNYWLQLVYFWLQNSKKLLLCQQNI